MTAPGSGRDGAPQATRSGHVVLRDGFRTPLRTVAGFALGLEDAGATTRAAAVLLDAVSLEVIAGQVARLPTRLPGDAAGAVDGGHVPALLAALAGLPQPPDLALIDGHGIAGAHRFGVATAFGVASGLPSIGVAQAVLAGDARLALHEMRGAFTPLRDGAEQIGWLLRSRIGSAPLVVSPGHRVAMGSAPELVMRFVTGHRLPEPTRLAILLAAPGAASTDDPTAPEPTAPPSQRPARRA